MVVMRHGVVEIRHGVERKKRKKPTRRPARPQPSIREKLEVIVVPAEETEEFPEIIVLDDSTEVSEPESEAQLPEPPEQSP